jgi:hypothetical protein
MPRPGSVIKRGEKIFTQSLGSLFWKIAKSQSRPLSATDASKTQNSVPLNFWNRVVGLHEFDRSLTERSKPFLLDDYLLVSPGHHRASLDS